MKFTLKELLALVTCVAVACGSIAWYSRIPTKDKFYVFICTIPLIIVLLTAAITFLMILIVAIFRKRTSRNDLPPRAPLPRRG